MNEKIKHIEAILKESAAVNEKLLNNAKLLNMTESVVKAMVQIFKSGGKVLLCGNGGSAADAQHIAAELSGKFLLNRDPLFAEALHVNTSYLTATANDFSFDEVYSRLVRAKGKKGDMLIGISTSGNSMNIVKALAEARKKEMTTVGMTGERQSKADAYCDFLIKVPTENTPRVQEAHILIGHILCEIVEKELFGQS